MSQLHLDGIEHASGPSSSSTSTKSEAEKDPKKASNTDVQMFVYTEKEQFEWREVIRGAFSSLLYIVVGLNLCRMPGYSSVAHCSLRFVYLDFLIFLFVLLVSAALKLILLVVEKRLSRPTIMTGLGYSGVEAQLRSGESSLVISHE